ncbi:MAG: hypothetical protein FJ042_08240 [Candidatus Cloacimonetes bacterium]|nr:hypothetical protein [Candidatus Cloacimonadota bacterium]
MKWLWLLFLLFSLALSAQNTLQVSGLNEAQFIYRTALDSLNAYFRDAFAFRLAYRNFQFGMKFVAELPKYSTNQSEQMAELDPNRLSIGWKELYASYEKDGLLLRAGTIEESFGIGMTFRSWEDLEFDQDNRVEGLILRRDGDLKVKALYSAIPNQNQPERLDLAYGGDLFLTAYEPVHLGFSALSYRRLTPLNRYNQQDVFAMRSAVNLGYLDAYAEYAVTELYRNAPTNYDGNAFYANMNLYPTGLPVQFGAAYKRYDRFNFRLQDLPTANHHNQTLADDQNAGLDEEGLQGWIAWTINDQLTLNFDYAEAWNNDQDKRMNDFWSMLRYDSGSKQISLEYSHVEKLDEANSKWQLEAAPTLHVFLPILDHPIGWQAEYKYVEKTHFDRRHIHYEPHLQAELTLGKFALAAGVQSWWSKDKTLMSARYQANIEVKYHLYEHSELSIFAGEEAGGKVCRNGICRFVAPFQGIRAELSTRF